MPQQEVVADLIASAAERPAGGLQRSGSASRLNAQAPEFVPRVVPAAVAVPPPPPPVIGMFAAASPQPRAAFFAAAPPPPHHRPYEYYAPVRGGAGAGFTAPEEQEPEVDPAAPEVVEPLVDGLPDEVVHKITKQVEYYFSDINLATTEHLMRFITKDPEGYVPITVIAGFNKIKALVHDNSMLATALRTSSKLVVSDDGKRAKRLQPFTVSDMQDLQSRIVVAENLPGDPCYQNLMKIFSAVASVKTIRTCYPQSSNVNSPVTNRSAKLDMLFSNKLHAFVEYETLEDAEKAILELNDEKNWRNGLRVRLFNTCMTKAAGKGKKGVHEADGTGEEDVSTSNQSKEKQLKESSQLSDMLPDHLFDDSSNGKEGPRRGRGHGRGGRGRGRGYHQHNNYFNSQNYHDGQHHNHHGSNQHHQGSNRSGAHHVGTPPNQQQIKPEQHPQLPIGATKQPPGPRMPDGTRGFTLGRGKPQPLLPVLCAAIEP